MGKNKKSTASSIIPSFIDKLCTILEDQTCSDYIDWTLTEDSFNIKDINRFTDTVLPKYFKHSNFSSFIRQLNMYGFNKIRHDQGQNVYKNDNFKRHNKSLLKNIKRKVNQNQKQDKLVVYEPTNSLNKQLTQLKARQKNLEGMCRQLIAQNNKILEQNNLMMKKLSQDQRQKNSKMEQLLVSLIMARGNNQLSLPNSEDGRMLSLTNESANDNNEINNNFEGFRQFLEDYNGISKLQEALKAYQSEQRKKNKSKSYTIVNSDNCIKNQQNHQNLSQNGLESHLQNPPSEFPVQEHREDDNQMLSLSDFLNIDDPIDPSQPLI